MTRLLITILFFGLTINAFGQKYYYYKPWKDFSIEVAEIVLTVDSVKSENGKEFIEKIANKISEQINVLGYKCTVMDIGSITNSKGLTIKLSLQKPAYVQLQALQGQIPLCNRVTFEQVNSQSNKKISTTINISVEKEEEAISPLVNDISQRIAKQMTRK